MQHFEKPTDLQTNAGSSSQQESQVDIGGLLINTIC